MGQTLRRFGSVRDARGIRVPVTSQLPTDVQGAMDRRGQTALLRGWLLFFIAFASAFIAASTLWLMLSRWPGIIGGWIVFAWPIGTLVVLGFAVAWIVQMRQATIVSRELLRTRRCGSCAYDLRGTPLTDDGQTICPECGGHWHLPNP
ncbi:MAG: hypothetical protein K2W85_12515 [Phycisphaerales bacterium]|nr:hypothetical protein [Phycisphaerales bacterium]